MTGTFLRPLTVEQVPLDDLRPDPANPRRISDEELDALERSIASSASSSRCSPVEKIGPSSAAISVSSRPGASGWRASP
jgi:hypothetical protein